MIKHCKNCGYTGEPAMKGNGWIEFLLYWLYFIPGVFYSIWRRSDSGRNVCPKCHSPYMVRQ